MKNKQPLVVRENDIRNMLLKRLWRSVKSPNTQVINELGLAHAKSRIDVAVINGSIHGYEIKSAKDSLARLPAQIEIYSKSLQKLTLVVASRHVDRVVEMIPPWCGVSEVLTGSRGGITLKPLRKAERNPEVDVFVLAHLLWRNEVHGILVERGAHQMTSRASRKDLYQELVEIVSESELVKLIKTSMAQRPIWREHQPL
ncbi:MAG: sce7726 family protein [Gammaproteobacteria bacterium]